MDIFGGKNRIVTTLCPAFLIMSFCRILVFFISLLPFDNIKTMLATFNTLWGILFCASFGGFAAYYILKKFNSSIIVAISLVFSSLLFYSFSGVSFSIVMCVLFGLFIATIIKGIDLFYASICSLMIACVIGLLLGVLYSPMYEMLKWLCSTISGKGALFGVINDFYSIAISDSFSKLFYHYDYSLALLVDNKLVSGVVDIFSTQSVTSIEISRYLSGKYFVNMFLPVGLFLSLFNKFNDELKLSFIFITLSAIITGDVRLLSAFLLLYNPFIYLGYLFCVFVSYFVARFVDIRLGFVDSGNIVELFKYNNHWLYFLITGIVLVVLMYFVVALVLNKFDFDKRQALPKNVRKIVNALGGDRNIIRIRNGHVYVKNPNLIDILKLDCDIHSNEVTLIQNDLDLLQNYF